MAGTNVAFNAATFRAGIRLAMEMGSPTNTADKATFRWNPVRDFAIADPAGEPYDWTTTPTATETHADVVTDLVAVEFSTRLTIGMPLGQLDPATATLTLLDEDYETVRGANEVLLGGNTYTVRFVAPPVGLFDVTVYTVYVEAVDET